MTNPASPTAKPDQQQTHPAASTRAIDRHAVGHDASHFLYIPQEIRVARTVEDVAAAFRDSAARGTPLTLRSGGTSLSGQAVTDGILLDVRKHFRRITVLDQGNRVRVQPGATVRSANQRLAAFGRKLGPDPASEAACTIGGVIANNSSGMACGITQNTYQTLESMTFVLPSGTIIATADADADERLQRLEPQLHRGLTVLRDRVRANPHHVAEIRRQFSMKNTMGYGINAFLDHEQPVDILTKLIIGSEGTLAFIAEATFRTVPVAPHIHSGLLIFDTLESANNALPTLVDSGAATLELLDALSLSIGQQAADAPPEIQTLAVDQHAALLVEYQAEHQDTLTALTERAHGILPQLNLNTPARLTGDPARRANLWHLRKGLYTTVAGARPQGTTALLEDVVVPVDRLARTCTSLIELFATYHYQNSVIFGHAKDGNVHFMLTDDFGGDAALRRYSDFTDELVELILGEGGSLKAEHGTGRVMAPFVRRQYGDELYAVMRELKQLCDPRGLLNPGVIINDDPTAHLSNIKPAPAVHATVDRCVECGYCEPVCPSKDLTLTPRQRIVALRAIEQAERDGDTALAAELRRDYTYESVQTCAVDGMCQTACPVDINTGALVKSLRSEAVGTAEQALWRGAAGSWGAVTASAGKALSLVAKLPTPLVQAPNALARAALGRDRVPLYSAELPGGGPKRVGGRIVGEHPSMDAVVAVYFPACVNTMFGPALPGHSQGVQHSFETLCLAADVQVFIPDGVSALCCGTPWSSKGLGDGLERMRAQTVAALRAASRDGALPIVCDASSCTEGLISAIEQDTSGPRLRVIDAVDFVAEQVLPRLPDIAKLGTVVVHPTCSSTRLGGNERLRQVAEAAADEAVIPDTWGCCAFAGDRGMLHPELTASATAAEAAEVAQLAETRTIAAHVSCNRTCELGMTRATGEPYQHVLEVLASRLNPQEP